MSRRAIVSGSQIGEGRAWSGRAFAMLWWGRWEFVELFEFLQSVEQVALVPDQGAVEQLVSGGLHPALHERIHARDPDAAEHGFGSGVLEDRVERAGNFPSRSRIRNRARQPGILEVHAET
jgi:hypothetical protein